MTDPAVPLRAMWDIEDYVARLDTHPELKADFAERARGTIARLLRP